MKLKILAVICTALFLPLSITQARDNPTGKIAFFSRIGNAIHVNVIDADGSNQWTLEEPLPNGSPVSWSPNGNLIAFTSIDNAVYIAELATHSVQQIAASGCCYGTPVWSIDGKTLLFGAEINNEINIYTYSINKREINPLLPSSVASKYDLLSTPSLALDGKQIAFVGTDSDAGHRIYIIADDGTNWKSIDAPNLSQDYPVWSPNGQQIAFIGSSEGNWYLYTASVDNLKPQKLASAMGSEAPAWSPDGKQIAFLTDNGTGGSAISLFSIGDMTSQVITDGPINHSPSWSPDGKYLVFDAGVMNTKGDAGSFTLYIYDVEKKISKPLERDTAASFSVSTDPASSFWLSPVWSPQTK